MLSWLAQYSLPKRISVGAVLEIPVNNKKSVFQANENRQTAILRQSRTIQHVFFQQGGSNCGVILWRLDKGGHQKAVACNIVGY